MIFIKDNIHILYLILMLIQLDLHCIFILDIQSQVKYHKMDTFVFIFVSSNIMFLYKLMIMYLIHLYMVIIIYH